jgi:hypothetical protein
MAGKELVCMNDGPQSRPSRSNVSQLLAAAALTLLVLSNLAWLVAYSSLSQRTVGVTSSPSVTTKPSASISPTPTPVTKGTINGSVGYPAGTAPAQVVCAVSTTDASVKYCADHAAGNALAYSLSVPAGTYYVYASLKAAQGDFTTSYKAYYDKFVTCGGAGNCAMGLHGQYEPVTVAAGGTVANVNPTDWYALGLGQ